VQNEKYFKDQIGKEHDEKLAALETVKNLTRELKQKDEQLKMTERSVVDLIKKNEGTKTNIAARITLGVSLLHQERINKLKALIQGNISGTQSEFLQICHNADEKLNTEHVDELTASPSDDESEAIDIEGLMEADGEISHPLTLELSEQPETSNQTAQRMSARQREKRENKLEHQAKLSLGTAKGKILKQKGLKHNQKQK